MNNLILQACGLLHPGVAAIAATPLWIDLAEVVFVLLSIVGQHFNSTRQVRGFYFWAAGNFVAVFMFAATGRWVTSLLYVYFLWKCATGINVWRQLDQRDAAASAPAPLEQQNIRLA